jgi:hypothetical protein
MRGERLLASRTNPYLSEALLDEVHALLCLVSIFLEDTAYLTQLCAKIGQKFIDRLANDRQLAAIGERIE